MVVLIKKPCLKCELHCIHFEISNMHLMSYCMLINFVNAQWPGLFGR